MVDMPIYNETDYVLTEAMTQHIIRDAQEHFGEEVRSVRVQSGIERHAFNVRTREVRYAFSPQDFGLVHTMPIVPETPRSRRRRPRRDDETAEEILPAPFEEVEMEVEVEVEVEDLEPLETSLESLDEGQDEDEDEDDVFKLDNQHDDEDDEDESFFDHDAYDA